MRTLVIAISLILLTAASLAQAAEPLRLAVIGFEHGHVEGLLWRARDDESIQIVGVWEPNEALFDRLAAKYGLGPELRFDDIGEMLDASEPEAASVMTSTRRHLEAVRACAPRGVHLLVEKPLAISVEHAEEMARLAERHGVHVLTNFETSWYASVHEARRLTREDGFYRPIRRAVFRHGHRGPIEIGCSEEFLGWLTDPEENGAGALFDFGCYGANLMTWLVDGELPTSVVATVSTLKPDLYPRVDDDATIVLTYPTATAVIQASWAWTHDNKEMDLHTERGSIHCGKWDELSVRKPDGAPTAIEPPKRPQPFDNEWRYLRAVVRGEAEVDPLSSLPINLATVRILDAARRSSETGERIEP
ncbi:MAG: oxidoreductase [Phycisphaerae bacterium]|nr:oxidoreductase [Phycisphaerae bacterium]